MMDLLMRVGSVREKSTGRALTKVLMALAIQGNGSTTSCRAMEL